MNSSSLHQRRSCSIGKMTDGYSKTDGSQFYSFAAIVERLMLMLMLMLMLLEHQLLKLYLKRPTMVIITVASALIYANKMSFFEAFTDNMKNVWTEWELRGLILLSLILQILLILLGKRRKYIARTWIRVTLWSAYLMADWVVTVALGVISISGRQNPIMSAKAKNFRKIKF
ncbi:hypothetical protein TEA_002601 [Camellia sinensis var. sinensis]|uniref:DUF4220 domain-containing protein n=1 Tax=Camellia sinensis var. sinensis TaxID=542762 RepID=A0A4S4DXN8_CAMSN|nr:hypothetical protein TEA_002601 [Camellia sinensis var. sinensis]